MNSKISFILPCYRPQLNWVEVIESNWNSIKNRYLNNEIELILVSDGNRNENDSSSNIEYPKLQHSTRGRQNFSDELIKLKTLLPEIKIVELEKNHGKGFALREGIKISEGQLCVFTDVDFPYTIDSLFGLVDELLSLQSDVIIGYRDEQYYLQVKKSRRLISQMLRMALRWFFHLPVDDTQCGLKGFNKNGKDIFLQAKTARYLFDIEFLFLSHLHHLKIKTVSVQLRPEIELPTVKISILLSELISFIHLTIFAFFSHLRIKKR